MSPSLGLRLALTAGVFLVGCGRPSAAPGTPSEVPILLEWMRGSFSSAEQAAADQDYFDIRLQMVPIWTARTDGPWLYVEQSVAGAEERPYRQRVYRLVAAEGDVLESRVFTFPDPLRYAGAWREAAPLGDLSPRDLEPREGCTVYLRRRADGSFAGSTIGESCESSLRGAAWATSDVVIRQDGLDSWDRGFASDGRQVWGAEKGPYRFLRVTAPEAEEAVAR